jgi:hypothetical protein
MKSLQLPMALTELISRNSAILTAYREWARRLTPGPVSRLASSIIEQRFELGKALGEAASELSVSALPRLEVEFEVEPSPAALIDGKLASHEPMTEPKILLSAMTELEAADHELLAAVAGAALPFSSVIAERLAGEAESARKRSSWAQDHLDLLSMG